MQSSYYGYSVKNKKTGKQVRFDLQNFFANFAAWHAPKTKAGLTYNSEVLCFTKFQPPVYLFAQCRDREIIKKIARDTLSMTELRLLLKNTESVGFASYVLIESDVIAIVSRVLSPRHSAFSHFVNDVFTTHKIDMEFVMHALTLQVPRSAAVNIHHVGKVSLTVDVRNPIYQPIIDAMTGGGQSHQTFDLGELDISVRPSKRRGENKSFLRRVSSQLSSSGLIELEARAQIEATDRITDVYLIGQGLIRDPISARRESEIPQKMEAALRTNKRLQVKLNDFRKDINLGKVTDPNLIRLSGASPWANGV